VKRCVVIAVLSLLALAGPAAAATPALPDLYQEIPYNLEVEQYGSGSEAVFHLGFGSTVYNFGSGPLRVDGQRQSTDQPEMVASQVITNTDGSTTTVPNIGRMRYVDSITHRHWHYLGFDTYALRTATGASARNDQKTGFCLGDRVIGHDGQTLPGQPPEPVFNGGCGYDEPELLEVSEGISPNYADPYAAQVEGQFVDLTGVPAGHYQLSHQVNQNKALRETDYSNDAASVLVSIDWPNGQDAMPAVRILSRCGESISCPVAPVLSKSKATSLAKTALRKGRVRGSGLRCGAPRGSSDSCAVKVGGRSAKLQIAYKVSQAQLFWTWKLSGRGVKGKSGKVAVPFGKGVAVPTKVAGQAKTAAAKYYCPLLARRG
jgi:hypothetical protein